MCETQSCVRTFKAFKSEKFVLSFWRRNPILYTLILLTSLYAFKVTFRSQLISTKFISQKSELIHYMQDIYNILPKNHFEMK